MGYHTNAPPTLAIRAPSRRQRWHAVEEKTAPRQRQISPPSSSPVLEHALGCLQYPVKCNLSVRVRLLVLKREMAHLPDDSLPSQFDVVVDGTGQEKSCLSLSKFLGV